MRMSYVDGYVLPVPKDKIPEYEKMARLAGKIWIEHGALEYRECVGDDLDIKELVPFPQLVKTTPEETVVFAWIVFESKERRDEINAKVMADPRLAGMNPENSPFDHKRMAFGGFTVLVAEDG
jgi:uncharacterized protein YbaA (DUF1428 family)